MKVIICKGLPASGKSTWARQMLKDYPGEYKRINKDEMRALFDDSVWSERNENFVISVRDFLLSFALLEGYSVIIDDTNLNPIHEEKIRKLVELHNSSSCLCGKNIPVTVEIKDFTDVPLKTCLVRDKDRANSVGEEVIRRMYNQYLANKKAN